MNDALNEIRGTLEVIARRLTELEMAQEEVKSQIEEAPHGETYKYTAWIRDRSKGERYKVRLRSGNKHICYQDNPDDADRYARILNGVISGLSECRDEEGATFLSGMISNAMGYYIAREW